jgi:16S rRNA (cytidine1402-2'-O)-methyltransferase
VNNNNSQIYLIPSTIAPDTQDLVITPQIRSVISMVDYYLVEHVRTARRFISSMRIRDVSKLHFEKYDKHTKEEEISELLAPLKNRQSIGVISEAGCPAIADPGNAIVRWAHKNKVKVTPLSGPSSILLALMASGMNGQRFEFHGYIPIDNIARMATIQALEKEALKTGKTQIFMETPYRNMSLAADLFRYCRDETSICIACELSSPNELIKTMTVAQWKGNLPNLHKRPTIFLLHPGSNYI